MGDISEQDEIENQEDEHSEKKDLSFIPRILGLLTMLLYQGTIYFTTSQMIKNNFASNLQYDVLFYMFIGRPILLCIVMIGQVLFSKQQEPDKKVKKKI